MNIKTLIVHLAFVLLAQSVHAGLAARTGPGEKWALIVVADASGTGNSLATVLEQDYGYRSANILPVFGPLVTNRDIHKALMYLLVRTSPSDSVFIHIEAPAIGEGADTAYLMSGSDAEQRWTQFTMLELSKLIEEIRSSSMLIILPLCVSPKSNVSDALGPLFARSDKSLSVITYCARDTRRAAGPPMSSTIASVLRGDRTADVPFGLEEVSELIQRSAQTDVRLWSPPGSSGQAFTFQAIHGRYTSYNAALLDPATELKVKEEAIQQLVESLLAEPPDRRAVLLRSTTALEKIARDGSAPSSLRLKAIWAIGEVQHPLALSVFQEVYAQSSSDAILRRSTVEAAATLTPPAGVELLRRALADPESTVSLVAIRALGQRRDEPSKSTLVNILQTATSPDVRVAALQSLSLFADSDGSLKAVVATRLDDPAAAVRREAIAAWFSLGGDPATDAVLAKLGTDPDATVRQTIAYSLGRNKPSDDDDLEDVVEALRPAATRENPPIVREAAIWSLGELGTAADRPLLGIINNPKDDPRIIAAAAEALGKQKSRRAVKPLIELMRSPDVEIHTSAAEALGSIGDSSTRVISALFEATRNGEPFLRAASEQALASLSPSRDDLRPLLKDPSPFVRTEAALKIGAARDANDVKDLSKLLSDPDPTVRDSVLKTLSQYNDDRSKEQVRDLLSADDPYRREAAAQLIGVWKWTDGTAALTESAGDADPRVRAQAVKSLGRIANPATESFVLTASGDRDPHVRLAAAEAMTSFSSPEVVTRLRAMSDDPNPEVRQAAIDALRKRDDRPPE